jgi:mRNA deadenylase 3'-5' endonuclease subunit Ccr4
LADSYVRAEWYPNVDPEILRWDRRSLALAERVARLGADIVCLQEVEADAYALLELSLGVEGYEGVYAKKGCGKPDGCAMFFRQGWLRCAGWETIYYRDGLRGGPDSGHLALVNSFVFEWGVVRVATTHLRWEREDKSPEEHPGYRQIRELINEHFKPDQSAYAWVICGDLNAQSDSAVFNELVSNGFIDAYAGHEQDTCNPNRRSKRIDYIFHTAGLLAEPARLMEIDDLTPLPSSDEPSDHLAIVARLEKNGRPQASHIPDGRSRC